MLEDATFSKAPKYIRFLSEQALRLLALAPGLWVKRLAAALPPSTDDLTIEAIRVHLDHIGERSAAAWMLCAELAEAGRPWATELLTSSYSAAPPSTHRVVFQLAAHQDAPALSGLIGTEVLSVIDPTDAAYMLSGSVVSSPKGSAESSGTYIEALRDLMAEPASEIHVSFKPSKLPSRPRAVSRRILTGIRIAPSTPSDEFSSLLNRVLPPELPNDSPWAGMSLLRIYAESPSAETFLSAVAALGQLSQPPQGTFPWVISACFPYLYQDSKKDLTLASIQELVSLDMADWKKAETRWQSEGIDVNDVLYLSSTVKRDLPYSLAEEGAPPTSVQKWVIEHPDPADIKTLLHAYLQDATTLALSPGHSFVIPDYVAFLVWCAGVMSSRAAGTNIDLEVPAEQVLYLAEFLAATPPRKILSRSSLVALADLAADSGLNSREIFEALNDLCLSLPIERFFSGGFGHVFGERGRTREFLIDGLAVHSDLSHLALLIASLLTRTDAMPGLPAQVVESNSFATMMCRLLTRETDVDSGKAVELLAANIRPGLPAQMTDLIRAVCGPISTESDMRLCAALLDFREWLTFAGQEQVLDYVVKFIESESSRLDDLTNWKTFGLG